MCLSWCLKEGAGVLVSQSTTLKSHRCDVNNEVCIPQAQGSYDSKVGFWRECSLSLESFLLIIGSGAAGVGEEGRKRTDIFYHCLYMGYVGFNSEKIQRAKH